MESTNTRQTQVVIIGAGPTGLSMAAQLIRHKIDFIIIERNEHTTNLSKAIVVQARTLELFQELGIAEEAIRRGKTTTGLNLFYKGKQKVSLDLAGLGEGVSEFTFALSLEQSKTEKLLAEYLAHHDKEVQWQCVLSSIDQQDDGLTVCYKDAAGMEHTVNAAYAVGCDGAGSEVRHQLGLSFEGTTEPKLFYVADISLESPVINKNRLYMYMLQRGFALFFPMEGEGHYRIVGIIPGAKNTEREYQFADIESSLRQQIISPIDFRQLHWFSTYRVHSRKAGAFQKGRCFIAGDAAHIHTPAGGQGMNTGIQDAYNLSWKLACALRGEVNDAVLETYNTERTANAKHLLQTTDRMFDIMSGVNRFWDVLRLHVFPLFLRLVTKSPMVRRRIFPILSQTSIAYPDSYLTQQSTVGKVKAGDRMHYFVCSDGRSIFSYLTEPSFKLIYFGGDHNDVAVPSRLTIAFFSFSEIPKQLFGDETNFFILLRPDNHISYIGKEVELCRQLIRKIESNNQV